MWNLSVFIFKAMNADVWENTTQMQIYTSARISEPDPPRSTAAARTAPDLQSYTITQLKKV